MVGHANAQSYSAPTANFSSLCTSRFHNRCNLSRDVSITWYIACRSRREFNPKLKRHFHMTKPYTCTCNTKDFLASAYMSLIPWLKYITSGIPAPSWTPVQGSTYYIMIIIIFSLPWHSISFHPNHSWQKELRSNDPGWPAAGLAKTNPCTVFHLDWNLQHWLFSLFQCTLISIPTIQNLHRF